MKRYKASDWIPNFYVLLSIIIRQIRWLLTFTAYLLNFTCITYTSHQADTPCLYLAHSLGIKLSILLLESLVGGRLLCMTLPFSQLILLHGRSGNLALSVFRDGFFWCVCVYVIAGAEFCSGVNSISPAETGAEFTQFWCSDILMTCWFMLIMEMGDFTGLIQWRGTQFDNPAGF